MEEVESKREHHTSKENWEAKENREIREGNQILLEKHYKGGNEAPSKKLELGIGKRSRKHKQS